MKNISIQTCGVGSKKNPETYKHKKGLPKTIVDFIKYVFQDLSKESTEQMLAWQDTKCKWVFEQDDIGQVQQDILHAGWCDWRCCFECN